MCCPKCNRKVTKVYGGRYKANLGAYVRWRKCLQLMKKQSNWDYSDIAWYATRLIELIQEEPDTAWERIQKEKKERIKLKDVGSPKRILEINDLGDNI